MPERTLEFFFDLSSAYSYLAVTQLKGFAERTKVRIRYRPFLLGAVFKATGNQMPASLPAKAAWLMQDVPRWAKHYGIPFRFPSTFPMNSLRPQRVLTALGIAHGDDAIEPAALALFHAYWAANQLPTEDAVLSEALKNHDAQKLLADAETQPVKDALRANTEEAVRRGAFGAPTLFLGDAMFFGNDRFALIEDALRE